MSARAQAWFSGSSCLRESCSAAGASGYVECRNTWDLHAELLESTKFGNRKVWDGCLMRNEALVVMPILVCSPCTGRSGFDLTCWPHRDFTTNRETVARGMTEVTYCPKELVQFDWVLYIKFIPSL